MPSYIDYDRDELLRFAPKAKDAYLDALLSDEGKAELRKAGICDTALRFAHFFGQCGGETSGFAIVRESLRYRSVKRLREVWPSRFRRWTDAQLEELLRDEVKLADAVYGGRMGNKKGTSDGYDFRGGGWIQTTGRSAVETYCKACGVEPGPDTLDNIPLTLKFACLEWTEANCNKWADENNLLAVSKAINTGSATSGVMPVGMEHRKNWLARAMAVWGDERAVSIAERSDATERDLAGKSSTVDVLATVRTVAGGGAAVGTGATVANEAAKEIGWFDAWNLPQLVTDSAYVKTLVETTGGIIDVATRNIWLLAAVLGVVGYVLARKLIARRIAEFRTGRYNPLAKQV